MADGSSDLRPEQHERMRAVLDAVPWGDLESSIICIDEALRLCLEATRADFLRWEEGNAGELRYGDEFSLTPG